MEPASSRILDYSTLAHDLNLTDEQLLTLEQLVAVEYPSDPMMQELRMLRTLRAIRAGRVTYDQVVREMAQNGATIVPS